VVVTVRAAVSPVAEFEGVRRWLFDIGKGDGGATDVGVGIGVFCDEREKGVALMLKGVLDEDDDAALACSGVWTSPNSPGAKVRVEQKPSEDVMRSVSPSLDQVKSVNVAQCRLLTIHSGVCCWVS
jgi:hypothetical protein